MTRVPERGGPTLSGATTEYIGTTLQAAAPARNTSSDLLRGTPTGVPMEVYEPVC
jgi:hypothetical protein